MGAHRASQCPENGDRAHVKAPCGADDATLVIEALLVVAAVAGVAALAWLAPLVPFTTWLTAAVFCTGAGLLLGVPTGFWYHVRLRACLAARDALPPRWWLHPVALHGDLAPEERRDVLRWFVAGGAGFVLTAVGCALAGIGVAIEWLGLARVSG
jgi:hypothetical protein